ncbi:hypothetical protein [Motilibacter aurantiacus]|uniref:hypothetical protein n=1 Tax=Motilibacter aurantiacus TaxID=2714955 RepID=UPI0014089A47|nr:hypothetical protein [Motilibacter aurantiacus]NHC43763.1 hypothetical protein [Motilibacter aurantiacus]
MRSSALPRRSLRTTRRATAGALAAVATLAPIAAAHAAPPAVPTARQIVTHFAQQDRLEAYVQHPRDEGPRTVVHGGLCSQRFAGAGCRQMVSTKDASVMVFGTARQASDWAGNADDVATAVGRVVLSYGSPARVAADKRPAYEQALRAYLRDAGTKAPEAVRIAVHLASQGLPMRDARDEGRGATRLGLAAEIPGATQLVTTDGPAVLEFRDEAAAKEYVSNADDATYRHGTVVLSYGSPARVAAPVRPVFEKALRAYLR